MMINRPTLTVCTTNYNDAQFLPASLQGIVEQSYPPTEFIIIDDGSTDNSYEILAQYAQKYPFIRLFRNEQNMGVQYNIKRLLEMASGEYIHFASANDKVLPRFFEKSMNLLANYPQAGLCSALSRVIDESGKDKGILPTPVVSDKPSFIPPAKVLQLMEQRGEDWILGHSLICRRQALIDAGGFIPKLGSFADGFIYPVIALRHGACFIPEPLSCWRLDEMGYSSSQKNDMERSLEVIKLVGQLMRTTYGDLFSELYIRKWEQRNLFDVGKRYWRNSCRKQEEFLQENFRLLCLQPSWLDHLFQTFLRMLIKAPSIAVQLYWFAKYSAWSSGLLNRYRRFKVLKRHSS